MVDTRAEVLLNERLTRIEAKLDRLLETLPQEYASRDDLELAQRNAERFVIAVERRVDKVEEQQTWQSRTILATVFTASLSLLTSVVVGVLVWAITKGPH